MNKNPDRLYQLLPVIYRQRDAEQGWPLRALLSVITEQVDAVEDDIAQLYENWFIETCQDWVVPYIGDLVGYQIVHEAGEPGDVTTVEKRQLNEILIPRRDVAHTIHHRRRKGTLKLLEELASDVAGWPYARAVEFYRLLGWTQALNSLQLGRGQTVNLRDEDALDRLDGPFDELAHTVDVRSIISKRSVGRYNIPSVGLFIWRLKVYSVTRTRARLLEHHDGKRFTFSILGNDTQLYTRAQPKGETQQITNELNYPTPIRRRSFERDIHRAQQEGTPSDYYGEDKSLFIWTGHYEELTLDASPQPGSHLHRRHQPQKVVWEAVDVKRIRAADLSKWHYRPREDEVAVDPVLGRLAFATDHVPEGGVRVLYHNAFSDDIGGGEYNRPLFHPAGKYQLFQVSKKEGYIHTIVEALELWENWKDDNPIDPKDPDKSPHNAIIEIIDSEVYIEDPLRIELSDKETLQIRAANHKRPIIFLEEERLDRINVLGITGVQKAETSGSRFTLDGLLIFGRGLQIVGELDEVTIRHCTLVPGWDLEYDCNPKSAHEASLVLSNTDARITIEHSVLGAIVVNENPTQEDPISIKISDSILDATDKGRSVLSSSDQQYPRAYATLTIQRSTVFGKVQVHSIELAENCIFNNVVKVARSQHGCVRFCYIPEGSRTPSRYNCQPDLVKQAINAQILVAKAPEEWQELEAEKQREIDRVQPAFNSDRYGTPDYCQLAADCAEEIQRGADDEAEMGVFHDLFQPQRAANLRTRIDEFTPAGMEAGIIYVN